VKVAQSFFFTKTVVQYLNPQLTHRLCYRTTYLLSRYQLILSVHEVNNLDLRCQIPNMNSWNDVATFPIANQFRLIVPSCLLITATETSTPVYTQNKVDTCQTHKHSSDLTQCRV